MVVLAPANTDINGVTTVLAATNVAIIDVFHAAFVAANFKYIILSQNKHWKRSQLLQQSQANKHAVRAHGIIETYGILVFYKRGASVWKEKIQNYSTK